MTRKGGRGTPPAVCSAMNHTAKVNRLLADMQALNETALHFAELYAFDESISAIHKGYAKIIAKTIRTYQNGQENITETST